MPARDSEGKLIPPPMRVVTKGWWVMKEERVPAKQLLAEERAFAERKK